MSSESNEYDDMEMGMDLESMDFERDSGTNSNRGTKSSKSKGKISKEDKRDLAALSDIDDQQIAEVEALQK